MKTSLRLCLGAEPLADHTDPPAYVVQAGCWEGQHRLHPPQQPKDGVPLRQLVIRQVDQGLQAGSALL